MNNITIIIPAYKPEEKLIPFVKSLLDSGFSNIVTVDDGCGKDYSHIFDALKNEGIDILTHEKNMGKGRALKTAFSFVLNNRKSSIGVITVDADGQHNLDDIVNVANTFKNNPAHLILGCRNFTNKVPFRSKFGNNITRFIYRIVSGNKISDTQTGLRAIPFSKLDNMLKFHGDRYEFEMQMLMELKNIELKYIEVPINTIYENNNEGSHFNTLRDSWLIYKVIFGFIASSVISFLVDYGLFSLLYVLLYPAYTISKSNAILYADILARIGSSVVNFLINRKVMLSPYSKNSKVWVQILKYYILATVVLAFDYLIVLGLSSIGINPIISKPIAAAILYIFSFMFQKHVVFK